MKIRVLCFLVINLLLAGLLSRAQSPSFIENAGQWEPTFDYKLRFSEGAMYLSSQKLTIDIQKFQYEEAHHEHGHGMPIAVKGHVYSMKLVDAREVNASPSREKNTYHNYFLGEDRESWAGGVRLFQSIEYQEVYDGVDVHYHYGENLKYEFKVQAEANPRQIKLAFAGQESLSVEDGKLVLKTNLGKVTEKRPYAYQIIGGEETEVSCQYRLKGDTVTFSLGDYQKDRPLIIDPELVFSTYTGAQMDNFGFTATFSKDDGGYVGGIVFGNQGAQGFPLSTGAYQDTFTGGRTDAVISRFSKDGKQLIYSTFLGGSGNDMPLSMIEGSQGSLYVLGNTGSRDYPVTSSAYDTSYAVGPAFSNPPVYGNNQYSADIFITKFSIDGKSLQASTLFGDTLADGLNLSFDTTLVDVGRGEIILDQNDNVYVATSTQSANFPTTAQSLSSTKQGEQDGVLFSLSPDLSSLRWSVLVGGTGEEALFSAKFTESGRLYSAGVTNSSVLPFSTSNSWRATSRGGLEGILLELDPANGKVLNFTYNGTSKDDRNYLLATDRNNNVYTVGWTNGNYPVMGDNVYAAPGSAQYIHKFSPNLNRSLKSTVFGDGKKNRPNISPTAFMVDHCNNVFVSGWGGIILPKPIGAIDSMPVTNNAFKKTTDGRDFYFFILDASWKKINYATYFGEHRGRGDHVDGGTSRFRKDGTIYQAVCASCGGSNNFPTTAGAYSSNNNSSNCNMALVRFKMEADSAIAKVQPSLDSVCIPYTADIEDLSFNTDILIVVRPDDASDTIKNGQITIDQPGFTELRFVGKDTTCQFTDTTSWRFYGIESRLSAGIDYSVDSCATGRNVAFKADTTGSRAELIWYFGDGDTSTLAEPVHKYRAPGKYTARLIAYDEFCGIGDTAKVNIEIKENELPEIELDYKPCEDFRLVELKTYSSDFHEFTWFIDGNRVGLGDSLAANLAMEGSHTVELVSRDTICDSTVTAEVEFESRNPEVALQMPNVFTPNNDGINDEFGPTGQNLDDFFQEYSLKVFDRWGTQVYSTGDYQNYWQGRQNGEAVTTGVYYYILTYQNQCGVTKELKGFIHLNR